MVVQHRGDDDLGPLGFRDAEVVLRAGEPQEYLNSHRATAALVVTPPHGRSTALSI